MDEPCEVSHHAFRHVVDVYDTIHASTFFIKMLIALQDVLFRELVACKILPRPLVGVFLLPVQLKGCMSDIGDIQQQTL